MHICKLLELDFFLRSAQNCKRCIFLDNLRTISQKGNIETRQMTPLFSSPFSNLTVCNIHFWKQPIETVHHTFLGSRHPDVTKNLYVLSTHRSQIPIFYAPAHGLIWWDSENECVVLCYGFNLLWSNAELYYGFIMLWINGQFQFWISKL